MNENKEMLGASENTIDYTSSYMNVYAIGTVFVQLPLQRFYLLFGSESH